MTGACSSQSTPADGRTVGRAFTGSQDGQLVRAIVTAVAVRTPSHRCAMSVGEPAHAHSVNASKASLDLCVGHAGDLLPPFPPRLSVLDLHGGRCPVSSGAGLPEPHGWDVARQQPAPRSTGPWFCGRYELAVGWASPEGGLAGGIFAAGLGARGCRWPRRRGAPG